MRDIVIDEAGLGKPLVDKLRKPADSTFLHLDQEGKIKVQLGVPVGEGNTITVPTEPHIFMADSLGIIDKEHPESLVLSGVPVIIGHGIRRKGHWVFNNNQEVAGTVRKYNEWARLNNMPELEFLAVCNEEPADSTGVRIGEFGVEDQNLAIAYAVGESVSVQGLIESDGRTSVNVTARNTIFNLNSLEVAKQVNIS